MSLGYCLCGVSHELPLSTTSQKHAGSFGSATLLLSVNGCIPALCLGNSYKTTATLTQTKQLLKRNENFINIIYPQGYIFKKEIGWQIITKHALNSTWEKAWRVKIVLYLV